MATKSTPRHDASSNAIAVANSDAGEPSTPTTTGRLDFFDPVGARCRRPPQQGNAHDGSSPCSPSRARPRADGAARGVPPRPFRLFRQVDKCWHGHRKEKLTVDFRTAIFAATRFGDFDCVREDLAARVPSAGSSSAGTGRGALDKSHGAGPQDGVTTHVDDGERHIAHRCLLRCPL